MPSSCGLTGFAAQDHLMFHIEIDVESMMETAACVEQLCVKHEYVGDVQRLADG